MSTELKVKEGGLVQSKTVKQEISVRLYPDAELRSLFRRLINEIEITSRGTGKMTINFSQFSPVSIDWRDAS